MIEFYKIPVWPIEFVGQPLADYYPLYKKILDNFQLSCELKYPNDLILFVDNTYLNGNQVLDIIGQKKYNLVIIFSLVDPPYTWHYLRELIESCYPGLPHILVGTDAPDIPTFFWLMYSYVQFSSIDDSLLELSGTCRVFLNYNFKMHQHRVRLNNQIICRGLDKFGTITTDTNQIPSAENHGKYVGSIGSYDVWRNHFLNIVSETVFRVEPELIVSEKMIKPIIGLRPFIINGSPRYYHVLKELNIDTFDDIFPVKQMMNSSGDIDGVMDRNHGLICDAISWLSTQDLPRLYQQLLPRLLSNRTIMMGHMQQQYQKFCVNSIEL